MDPLTTDIEVDKHLAKTQAADSQQMPSHPGSHTGLGSRLHVTDVEQGLRGSQCFTHRHTVTDGRVKIRF